MLAAGPRRLSGFQPNNMQLQEVANSVVGMRTRLTPATAQAGELSGGALGS